MKIRLFFLAIFLFAAQGSMAQSPTARALIEAGASAYLKDGATAAVKEWIKGSALDGNTQAISQSSNSLRQVEDLYGKATGFEVIHESSITEKSKLMLFAINFQKGVLFARMQVYQLSSGEWVTTEFKFHTEAAQLFPNSVLYRQ